VRSITGECTCGLELGQEYVFLAQKVEAHGRGRKVDSVHDGTPSFNGVRGLCTRFNDTEMLSAGADGIIKRWDITGGSLGREMGTIRVRRCPPHPVGPSSLLLVMYLTQTVTALYVISEVMSDPHITHLSVCVPRMFFAVCLTSKAYSYLFRNWQRLSYCNPQNQ
jgi:hypothetical protein